MMVLTLMSFLVQTRAAAGDQPNGATKGGGEFSSVPTNQPTNQRTIQPTNQPTNQPTFAVQPAIAPIIDENLIDATLIPHQTTTLQQTLQETSAALTDAKRYR
jgi:hypothetical protein